MTTPGRGGKDGPARRGRLRGLVYEGPCGGLVSARRDGAHGVIVNVLTGRVGTRAELAHDVPPSLLAPRTAISCARARRFGR